MKTRVITAVVLLPLLLLVVLFAPKIFTAIVFGILASVGAYELLVNTGYIKEKRLSAYSMVMAFAVAIISYFGANAAWILGCALLLMVMLFSEIMISKMTLDFKCAFLSFAGGFLFPYLLSSLIRIHVMENGRFFILIPFMIAFMSDTGAYFTGMAIGKHKLAPVISPKKTVEGVVGGVVFAVIGMVIYCFVLQAVFSFTTNYIYAVIYGILGSVAAVFGDLCLSVIKRQTGIKDYGKLFPGHGGVLDRFDSMLMVAPLAELLLTILPLAV